MKYSSNPIGLAVATVFLLIGANAFAQDEPPGNIAEMWTMHADPGAVTAFEAAFKEHVALRSENDDPYNWQVFVNHTGELRPSYYIRACCFSWADRDAYETWSEEHPQVMEHWQSNVAPHVKGYEHDFEEMDFENSHWPDGAASPKYVGVTTYKIAPGGWRAFNSAKAELSRIAIDNGWASDEHRWAWSSLVNGHPSVSIVFPYDDYADMTTPDPSFYDFLSEQVGAEKAGELFQRMNSATKGSYYQIYAHRPDLSMPE